MASNKKISPTCFTVVDTETNLGFNGSSIKFPEMKVVQEHSLTAPHILNVCNQILMPVFNFIYLHIT